MKLPWFHHLRAWHKVALFNLLGLCTGILLSASFQNCSQAGFQTAESIQNPISTSCGTRKKVTEAEMHNLIQKAHWKTSSDDRVQCPGFFAEIDTPTELDETGQLKITLDRASLQKQIAEANDCNFEGPPEDNPSPGEKNPTRTKEDIIKELVSKTDAQKILRTISSLSDGTTVGPTRYHASSTPRRTPEWIMSQFQQIANGRSDIRIRLVEHRNTPQPSVEAIIEGSGPDKNKFFVIGGHQDSIQSPNSRSFVDTPAPGADDNASGVASVLESFRVLVESGQKPNASIAFYTYAAEEIGLVGSQEIAQSYANSGKEVLGVIQTDMTAFSSGATDEITFITDYTSQTLTSTAADLASRYVGLKISYATCGYACSDHASWTRYNFRSIMPAEKEFETAVRRIHTINDKVDNLIKPTYTEKFAKLSVALAVTLGF